jgi:hypothetical protein
MQREQQYLPQKEFQKTGLSVQAPRSSSNATVVHQIMTELSKAVSEEDRVTVITKLVLNLTLQARIKWTAFSIGRRYLNWLHEVVVGMCRPYSCTSRRQCV